MLGGGLRCFLWHLPHLRHHSMPSTWLVSIGFFLARASHQLGPSRHDQWCVATKGGTIIAHEVLQSTCWILGDGLRRFFWQLPPSKASLHAKMVGINCLMIFPKTEEHVMWVPIQHGSCCFVTCNMSENGHILWGVSNISFLHACRRSEKIPLTSPNIQSITLYTQMVGINWLVFQPDRAMWVPLGMSNGVGFNGGKDNNCFWGVSKPFGFGYGYGRFESEKIPLVLSPHI